MVVLVKSDDWQGLYINGKLWEENHHIDLSDIIEGCKRNNISVNDLEEVWVSDEYQEKLEDLGNFPDDYSEVEVM